MKILMLTDSNFPPLDGGIAVFLSSICKELHRMGHRIEVLALATSCDREMDQRQPFGVHRYKVTQRGSSIVPIFYTIYHFLKHRYDVIFLGNFFTPTYGIGALIIRKLFKVPYAILIHGLDLSFSLNGRGVDRFVANAIIKNASLVFANSEYTKNEIMKTGYRIKQKVIVSRPGVDVELFHPGINSGNIIDKYGLHGKKIALTISRLVQRKGHKFVLRAIPKVIEHIPSFVYVIVGTGRRGEEELLKGIVKELGIEQYVLFLGYVEQDSLPLVYCSCDVFVMPSYVKETGDYEGFGISFLEASACGKPIIGGNSGGVPEAVVHGVTGLLVDPLNSDEIAESLIRVLTDKEYSHALGRNGRERVERDFRVEMAGEKIIKALEGLTA